MAPLATVYRWPEPLYTTYTDATAVTPNVVAQPPADCETRLDERAPAALAPSLCSTWLRARVFVPRLPVHLRRSSSPRSHRRDVFRQTDRGRPRAPATGRRWAGDGYAVALRAYEILDDRPVSALLTALAKDLASLSTNSCSNSTPLPTSGRTNDTEILRWRSYALRNCPRRFHLAANLPLVSRPPFGQSELEAIKFL